MKTTTHWMLSKRLFFRLFFVYTLLFTLPFPFDVFETTQFIADGYDKLTWKVIIPVVSEHVFHIPFDSLALPRGSGDTTYNYLQLVCFLMISIFAVVVWSVLDRKRKNYNRLLRFFLSYIALYLICYMFLYGFIKVYKLQFPDPYLSRLVQPYGESSPMGIAWTFMGASKLYTFFSGLAEVIAGFLLIFRRTRTLGAFVCVGVMLNIFMMNMSYDIPVKIFSFHLMLFALFILLQDWRRLLSVFITKEAMPARSFPNLFTKSSWRIAAITLKSMLIICFLYVNITNAQSRYETYGPHVAKPPMYGIYDITSIIKNNDTIPLLITDDNLWRRVLIQSDRYALVYNMQNTPTRFTMKMDTTQKTVNLEKYRDSTEVFDFDYVLKDSILSLHGTYKGDTLRIKAKQYDLRKFKLINRGFHWINEYPYNR